MSMSHESTSLKKSSSDCLKLAKQWYSISDWWNDVISELPVLHFLR